ncbi:DUF5412 domain-containing protein, partial [Peptostreptococcaceae bacterium OttesenSCG-928-C18]|nr:DUF5412 domain-containing protein [Peptostreptococcaceae bacterium OttesenSCG-928-C18]
SSMQRVKPGELANTVVSPDGKYTIELYYNTNNISYSDSILGVLKNNETGETKNIYWRQQEYEAEASWIDNKAVLINDITLDIEHDVYDWRKDDDWIDDNYIDEEYWGDISDLDVKRLRLSVLDPDTRAEYPEGETVKVIEDESSIESFMAIWDDIYYSDSEYLELYTDDIEYKDFKQMYYLSVEGVYVDEEDPEEYSEEDIYEVYILAVFLDDKNGDCYINLWYSDITYVLTGEESELIKDMLLVE